MPDRSQLWEYIRSNVALNQLTAFEENLFHRIACACGESEWMDGRPEAVKELLYPNRDVRVCQIKAALRALFSAGLLSTAKRDGQTFVRLTVWDWCLASHSSDSAAKKKKPSAPRPPMSRGLQERFDRFWKAYPRKVGKGAAEKKFAQIRPDAELTDKMIRAVEDAKRSAQWSRDGGQYIPHPATWLNQKRWEDEPPEPETPTVTLSSRGLEDWDEQ